VAQESILGFIARNKKFIQKTYTRPYGQYPQPPLNRKNIKSGLPLANRPAPSAIPKLVRNVHIYLGCNTTVMLCMWNNVPVHANRRHRNANIRRR
jgi:hypothetical protein